jgi:NDP-sugar pyrophosphorylase family protein
MKRMVDVGQPKHGPATGLRAVILAGGKGTRLKPFTINFPKPLVPLGDKPVIEILISRLIAFGIRDITLTLGHLAELVKAYFQHRHELTRQITLQFIEEDQPTGTAGSIAAVPGLDETFLAMNGDLLTDIDFHALVAFHREQRALLTVATHTRRVKIDLGVLEFDLDHRIRTYIEKPEMNYHVSMGIYVYEPAALRYMHTGEYLDFPNLVHRLLEHGERVCAFPTQCLWLDIGRPDDYAQAQELYAETENTVTEHV